jgi:hypothetical protein
MAINAEGSFVDPDGTLRHFGRQAFVALAMDLDRCFVCGVASHESNRSDFNDEHVIPDWVLRRFALHSRRITLPNGREFMYGRYTLRCCVRCNSLLAAEIETPISKVLNGTYEEVCAKLGESDPALLYKWLCLLFIKCHLKDREIRIDPDMRVQSENLGGLYDWDGLHHIHSVARSPHSRASIDSSVLGTTFVFPMQDSKEPFDFGNLSDYSTISLRVGSVGIASVLNDCRGVEHLVREYFSVITGPLSGIQLREVAARLAYGNTLMRNRPKFWSELDRGDLTIRSLPANPWPIPAIDRAELGNILVGACGSLLRNSRTPDVENKISQILRGEIQFLYHDDGSFISDSEDEIKQD